MKDLNSAEKICISVQSYSGSRYGGSGSAGGGFSKRRLWWRWRLVIFYENDLIEEKSMY